MAKSSNFFGLRTGSTKSLTFQVYRGQQITKDRVTRVSNPRSEAQMKQRLLIPMVANCRSMLTNLVDHSFEGITYGYESRQHFNAINLMKGHLDVVSYVPKGARECGLANFKISEGTLPRIDTNGFGKIADRPVMTCPSINAPVMTAHAELKAGDAIPADYIDALLAQNTNLQKGDQLTMLELVSSGSYKVDDYIGLNKQFVISRIILDAASADFAKFKFVDNEGGYAVFSDGIMNVALFAISEGELKPTLSFTSLASSSPEISFGGTSILSRQVNGVWKRSTAELSVNDAAAVSSNLTYDKAVATYLEAGSVSAKYLNKGKEGPHIIR